MSKVILILLLVVMSSNAPAASAKWVKVVEDKDGTTYVDTATIMRDGNTVKIWLLSDLKPPFTMYVPKSMKTQDEYDCKKKIMRTLNQSLYGEGMGLGKEMASSAETFPWHTIPHSDEAILKFACGK